MPNVYVREKEQPTGSGNFYLYLVEGHRKGGKVRTKHVKYLGRTDNWLTAKGFAHEAKARGLDGVERAAVGRHIRGRQDRIKRASERLRDLPEPKSRAEAEQYAREARRKLPLFRMAERTSRAAAIYGVSTAGKYETAPGVYVPERARLHRRIVRKLLNPKAAAVRPKAVFMIGLPASGKSTSLRPEVRKQWPRSEWTAVDPDEVKEALPEYLGWNSSYVQRESSHVAKSLLYEAAAGSRHNLMIDEVGDNAEKILTRARRLNELGYQVHVYYARIPTHKSVYGAVGRFAAKGRYVPPSFILEGLEDGVEASVQRLARDPIIQDVVVVDGEKDPHDPNRVRHLPRET